MKFLYTLLFTACFFVGSINAQFFKASLDNDNQDLIIYLTPDSELNIGFSTAEFFIRLSTADADKVDNMVATSDETNFPDLAGAGGLSFIGTDTQGSEAGFVHYHFSWQEFNSEIPSTYEAGTAYRIATIRINAIPGMEDEIVVAELVHNDFFSPSYLSLFGGGLDRFDYTGSDAESVFDDDELDTTNNGDGSITFSALQLNVPLPIKLKFFTAAPFENRDANLDWVTATEVDASHFEIERSDDGVAFTQIGRVEAVGNSNVDQDYKFTDREVNMERNDLVQYYRLKIVDLDGEYKYSGIRVVNFTRSDIDFTINAYPNPTSDFVQLNLTGVDNTTTERPLLLIYNNTGELIRSTVLDSDLGRVDMSDLPGSVYHFMINYKGQTYNEKIVVIK